MNQRNRSKDQQNGAFVGIGVGVGSSLSAMVGTITDDWYWTPIILSVCIGLGALAALLTNNDPSEAQAPKSPPT